MSPRARQSRKRTRIQEQNEQRILDAALDVFSTFGYRGSTVDQIARGAGMSKPNLLYYFASKDAIYLALLEHTLEEWLEPLKQMDADGDPADEIAGYIERKLEMSRKEPEASRLFATEVLQGAPRIRSVLEGELKALVDEKCAVIQGWIENNRLAPVDPLDLIFMIWAATQHYADFETQINALSPGSRDARFDSAAATLRTVFLKGLLPR